MAARIGVRSPLGVPSNRRAPPGSSVAVDEQLPERRPSDQRIACWERSGPREVKAFQVDMDLRHRCGGIRPRHVVGAERERPVEQDHRPGIGGCPDHQRVRQAASRARPRCRRHRSRQTGRADRCGCRRSPRRRDRPPRAARPEHRPDRSVRPRTRRDDGLRLHPRSRRARRRAGSGAPRWAREAVGRRHQEAAASGVTWRPDRRRRSPDGR